MAYVKIKQIHSTLNVAIAYVVNEAKISPVIEGSRLGSLVTSNCAIRPWEADDVLEGFDLTATIASARRGRGRPGHILAHHIIQSFAPGEVDEEVAHEIGVRFIEEITGGDYDYVIATHVDREHIHNHILFSPIHRETLQRIRTPKTFLGEIRQLSDALCLEYGLSVITPETGAHKAPSIGEVYASAQRRSKQEIVRERIDEAIRESTSWHEAVAYLRAHNVEVETRPTEIVYRLTDEDMRRPVRGSTLGIAYTEQSLQARLAREYVYDFTVQTTMMEPFDKNSMAIFMPGSRPYRYVVIPTSAITYHGRTASFFLPESRRVQILNDQRNLEGSVDVVDLYEYFAKPDHARDLQRATRALATPAFSKEIQRGASAAQRRYYAMVDRKIEALREDTFVATRVAEYLACSPQKRDTYYAQLVTDIADAQIALEGTILAWQEAADRGMSGGKEEEYIGEAVHHLALLRQAKEQIDEHRRDNQPPTRTPRPRKPRR